MRTRVTIDGALYPKALEIADPDMDKAEIFREAVKTFVQIRPLNTWAPWAESCRRWPIFPENAAKPSSPRPKVMDAGTSGPAHTMRLF